MRKLWYPLYCHTIRSNMSFNTVPSMYQLFSLSHFLTKFWVVVTVFCNSMFPPSLYRLSFSMLASSVLRAISPSILLFNNEVRKKHSRDINHISAWLMRCFSLPLYAVHHVMEPISYSVCGTAWFRLVGYLPRVICPFPVVVLVKAFVCQ